MAYCLYFYAMPYKIAIVDDQDRILSQLTKDLDIPGVLDIVFTAKNGTDYLLQMKGLAPAGHPQVVIMDIEMPVMDGLEALRKSADLYPEVQYVMFTVVNDDVKLFEAIKAGAAGYLLKDEPADAIMNAIKEVIDKSGAPMSPSIARKALKLLFNSAPADIKQPANPSALSDRETEILNFMVAGLNYKQIAEKLFISPNTVRNHFANVYTKLHVTSKAQAVQQAMKNKWV